ncbi:MAG: aconitase family protein [Pseudomonadales bacterium]
MAPEYGATCGFFPIDQETLNYLRLTSRPEETIELVEAYARAQGLWREPGAVRAVYSDTLELDLGSVVPSLAGPKRPQDRRWLPWPTGGRSKPRWNFPVEPRTRRAYRQHRLRSRRR